MTIRYYDLVIISDEIKKSYAECIDNLTKLDTKAARFHQLKGWTMNGQPVFAAGKGVDDGTDRGKGRLLFTYVPIHGQTGLCCYQELANHEYDRIPLSQEKSIEALLKGKMIIPVSSDVSKDTSEFVRTSTTEDVYQTKDAAQHIIYYRDQFICLDDIQQQILFTTDHWPVVMSGPPGSGKSCVAIALLNAWTKQAQDHGLFMEATSIAQPRSSSSQTPETMGAPQFAYIAESNRLRRRMQAIWRTQPGVPADLSQSVQFTNYQDILKRIDPEGTQGKRFLTKEESRAEFKKHIKDFLKCLPAIPKSKGRGKGKTSQADIEQEAILHEALYQEALNIAGCDSLEAYLKLGPWVSQFNDDDKQVQKSIRTKLFHAFRRYVDTLKANRCIDPLLYRPTCALPKLFFGSAVDEAQDYAPVQTWLLKQIAQNERVAYGVDTHQNVGEGAFNSIRTYLEQTLKANNITLNYPYRCPNRVIDMANVALELKLRIAGGLADKNDYPKIVRSETDRAKCQSGHVSYTASLPTGEAFEALKQRMQGNAHIAIVTHAGLVEVLGAQFGKHRVFTPQQIKGLEFREIYALDVFSDKRYYAANKYLASIDNKDTSKKSVQHRNKQKVANLALKNSVTAMNELFTTLTRSTDSLHIYQPDNAHQLQYITQPFKDMVKTFVETSTTEAKTIPTSTHDDWMKQINDMIEEENPELTDKALSIWINELKYPEEAFEAHRQQILTLPPVEAKVMMPAPSSSSSETVPKPANKTKKTQASTSSEKHIPAPTRGVKQNQRGQRGGNIQNSRASNKSHRGDMTSGFRLVGRSLIEQLTDAVSANQAPQVQGILQQMRQRKMPIDSTPLLAALAQGYLDIAQLLIDGGVNILAPNPQGYTPLIVAAQYGHLSMVDYFLRHGAKSKINHAGQRLGETALKLATQNNHHDVVKLLLANGAKVDIADDRGILVLHTAAHHGYESIVELLLQHGAKDMVDKRNQTALIHAAEKGHLGIIKLLLRERSDVDYINHRYDEVLASMLEGTNYKAILGGMLGSAFAHTYDGGITALTVALKSNHSDTALYLLEQEGINIETQNQKGMNAFLLAANKHLIDVVKSLLKHPFDRNIKDNRDFNALILTMTESRKPPLELIELLITAGVDVNAATEDLRTTPLIMAVANQCYEVTERLLAAGADINAVNRSGATPLIVAVENGDEDMVRLLLQAGADKTFKLLNEDVDERAHTAASLARKKGYHHLADIIDNYQHILPVSSSGFFATSANHGAVTVLLPPIIEAALESETLDIEAPIQTIQAVSETGLFAGTSISSSSFIVDGTITEEMDKKTEASPNRLE